MPRRLLVLGVALLWACGEPSNLDGMRSAGRHPEGWATASGHGQFLEARGYPLDACYGCHAVEGTREEGACNSCHEQGVNDCETCHAEPGGAHDAHVRFGCETCHEVPGSLATPGHLDDRGGDDVRFTGAALVRGHAPAYDAQTSGCTDTACHAGDGARTPAPRWTDGAQACGACHGNPPPNHPDDRCDRCHGEVVDATGNIIDPSKHADGVLQARDWLGFGCGECHGAGDDPWPTSGAHPAHKAPDAAKPVACATCHVVPTDSAAPGHVIDDPSPGAEVRLAPLAGEGASYAAGACSDTTCHGDARPTWTGSAQCGTCHGVPPRDHPPGDCVRCHQTAGPGETIAQPQMHIDGQVDVAGIGPDDCADCHAEGAPAYPAGSHPGHARFECTECHRLPDPARVVGHLDGDPAIALQRGGAYQGTTCADTGCHGPATPDWADPGSVQGCGACHGNPPAGHADGQCVTCHPLGDATHVNGTVETSYPQACDACHGNPPESGAHLAHMQTDDFAPVACEACHAVPDRVEAPGHLDPSPVEVAPLGGRFVDGTCADTACHAGPDASLPAPAWAGEPGAAECGACHGVPPAEHPPGNCAQCHGAVIDAQGRIIAPRLHANGRTDFR